MARKKRSLAEAVAVKPAPAPMVVAPKVAERVMAAICPLCGRAVPEKRAIKSGYITVDRKPYFDSIDWDENKPFGVAYPLTGRGSLRDWEYISPEQAPELFEALRQRFIQALREWINKGWLSQEEIRSLLR